MKVYLENIPLHEAKNKWLSIIKNTITEDALIEKIPATESIHRVTAEAITSTISSPFYHSSAMDGYAVRFSDTFGASETNPVFLKIPEQAVYLDTGDPVIGDFNAVIKIEDLNIVEKDSKQYIEILSPVTPWQNVRVIGEDIVATELILPQNHIIRPVDVAAMLAGGIIDDISVKKKPIVGIIPTGDEIVEPGSSMKKGDIIDTNSWMLSGLLAESGAQPLRYSIVPDKKEVIRDAIKKAVAGSDMVLVIAGSSAGTEDFTSDVIRDLGEVIVHGVGIKPGKPVILGIVQDKPVVGIPGYPVSAFLAFRLFVRPILEIYYGAGRKEPEVIRAKLSRQVASSLGVEEFVRVKLGSVSGNIIATPMGRGAGLLMSLVRADGLMQIPEMSEGFGAETEVDIELLTEKREIENTVVCIGSHDNTLDLIANHLKRRYPLFSLSSAHVGSMGGIIAIKKEEAHMAGTHLYDEETGLYNVPFIKKSLGKKRIKLINLVYREQGLMVLKGNPKEIKVIEDLAREDIVFINRQNGSGTRLLTDKCLKEFSVSPQSVKGYDRVEFTHMAVAAAVKSGVADAGIGIYAAAQALELDFIPVARERYDIILPEDFIEDKKLQAFMNIIQHDKEFRAEVMRLGGYDISDMGKVMYEQ